MKSSIRIFHQTPHLALFEKYSDVIEALRELIELLPALNIPGDTDLETMRQAVKDKFAGISPDDINGPFGQKQRETLSSEAKELLENMSSYLA